VKNQRINHKRYDTFEKPGFVVERDSHFCVNYIPVIDGFTAHAVKEMPKLDPSQWVEVIHRNGSRSKGPVETFAWKNYACHPNVRQDYILRGVHRDTRQIEAYDIIDLEITHYRLLTTPPEWWQQDMPDWPGMVAELAVAA
jgi:hypothetical protein